MPDIFGQPTEEEIAEEKRKAEEEKAVFDEKLKEYKKRLKVIAASINKSTFWMSYCGMQKAIRLGNAELTKKLIKTAWLHNRYPVFRRLLVILFEDVNAVNQKAINEVAHFVENGRTYNNLEDVQYIGEILANSVKCRDGDDLGGMCISQGAWTDKEKNHPLFKIAAKYNQGLHAYSKNDFDYDDELLRFLYRAGKTVNENQYLYTLYLDHVYRKKSRKKEIQPINTLTSPGHEMIFEDVMPYTVLDVHGFHGKQTLSVLAKKMKEDESAINFLKKYDLLDREDLVDLLGGIIFGVEGRGAKEMINLTEAHVLRWDWFLKRTSIPGKWEDLANDFQEFLPRIQDLRTWAFNKMFKKSIKEIKRTQEIEVEYPK